jgi:hypothetical protein
MFHSGPAGIRTLRKPRRDIHHIPPVDGEIKQRLTNHLDGGLTNFAFFIHSDDIFLNCPSKNPHPAGI